jgi:hypothetical protein
MKKQIISLTLVVVGFLLGATALSALASGTWTPPTATPPGGNIAAPINVGPNATTQEKTDSLIIDGVLALKSLVVNPGSGSVADNQVLTSSGGNGTAVWAQAGGGSASTTMTAFDPTSNILYYRGSTLQGSSFPSGLVDNSVSGATNCPTPTVKNEQVAIPYPSTIPANAYAVEITSTVGGYSNGAGSSGLVFAQVSNSNGSFIPVATTWNGTTASQYADAMWSINSGTVMLPYNPSRQIYINWSSGANCSTYMFVRTNISGYLSNNSLSPSGISCSISTTGSGSNRKVSAVLSGAATGGGGTYTYGLYVKTTGTNGFTWVNNFPLSSPLPSQGGSYTAGNPSDPAWALANSYVTVTSNDGETANSGSCTTS